MNANANIAPVITADNDALTRDFPLKPFGIKHKLSGHPLLSLSRVAKLASEMPRDLIEYNSGNASISQDPDKVKSVDLDPVAVVKSIETAGAWMVIKRIEKMPEYRQLLEDALTSVARARGFSSVEDAGFSQIEGFMFVSSPNSTTPFHMDAEDNFFVQIHGDKTFAVFDNRDGGIANEEQVEHSTTKHRNVPYNDSFMPRGTVFKLVGGDGCYIPYQWPHWVKTAGTYSISLAITWKTEEVKRMNDLHFFNSMLRSLGMPQAAPGKNASLDAMKLAVWRSARAVIEPLRSSETMRRVIRRIALGKNANYYLKKA